MRVFLVTSKAQQVVEFVVGILWAAISAVVVLFVKKYLKKAMKTE
jgi:hypothetical protein